MSYFMNAKNANGRVYFQGNHGKDVLTIWRDKDGYLARVNKEAPQDLGVDGSVHFGDELSFDVRGTIHTMVLRAKAKDGSPFLVGGPNEAEVSDFSSFMDPELPSPPPGAAGTGAEELEDGSPF